MKITVIGPGAIGCLIAAYLAKAGEDVCLLDYHTKRAALLRESGITVDGTEGTFHTQIEAIADP